MRVAISRLVGVVEHTRNGDIVHVVFPLRTDDRPELPERMSAHAIGDELDLYPMRSSSHRRLLSLLGVA